MIMAGSLGEWSVDDLLQIARITQKTTSIQVIGGNRKGVVYARSGRLVAVDVEPDPRTATDPMTRLVEGVALLVAVTDGTFEFGTHEVPEGGQSMDIKEVMRAIERDVLRERRLAELGVDDTQPLALRSVVTEPITLDATRWRVLAGMMGRFSLESLEYHLGRRTAVGAILMLDSLGLLDRLDGGNPAPSGMTAPMGKGHVVSPADTYPPVDPPAAPQAAEPVDPPMPAAPAEDTASATPERSMGEPIVEIFDTMHEVVTPSETTLIPGVLDDLQSRFRRGPRPNYEDFED